MLKLVDYDLVAELKISDSAIKEVIVREWQELERRERVDRGSRPVPDLSGRVIILVDDGIATGLTLKAAISIIKQQQPIEIVVAVPVAPPDICEELEAEVDEFVCLAAPEPLRAVSLWYEDFSATSDEEVCRLLAQNTQELKAVSEKVN